MISFLNFEAVFDDISAARGTILVLTPEQPYLDALFMKHMTARHYFPDNITWLERFFTEWIAEVLSIGESLLILILELMKVIYARHTWYWGRYGRFIDPVIKFPK